MHRWFGLLASLILFVGCSSSTSDVDAAPDDPDAAGGFDAGSGLDAAPAWFDHDYQIIHCLGGAAGKVLYSGLHVEDDYLISLQQQVAE